MGGNSIGYSDRNGLVIDTPFDLLNVALGAASAVANISQGNYGAAAVDALGVAIDIAAAATPGVPGGAATAINASRVTKLRNGHLAGSVHPKTGVPFCEKGFPDFSKHLYKGGRNDVHIKPTGKPTADFAAANKEAGYKSTPKGYSWHHHHQDTGRMQLVEKVLHRDTGHTGGMALW